MYIKRKVIPLHDNYCIEMSMKKLFFVIIAAMALTSLCCTSCTSDDDEKNGSEIVEPERPAETLPNGTHVPGRGYLVDGSFYTIDTDGNVWFLDPPSTSITSITIPENVTLKGKTYTVTHIKDYAFSGLKQLTTVKLPNTITYLGNSAFTGCDNLASINLPDSLKDIKIYTFQYCKALTSITFPKGLTSISNYAFNGCEHLKSISFPTTLRAIGQEAFRDCHELDSVILPDGFNNLGLNAFRDCWNITYIYIPASVRNYLAPFEGCYTVTSVNISSWYVAGGFGTLVTKLVLGEGVQNIGENAFDGCTQLSSVEFPSTVTIIGPCSFRNCISLTSIVFPENLILIHDRAFYGCQNLKSVTCLAPTPPSFPDVSGYPVFDSQTQEDGTLYVPSDLVERYKSAPGWKDFKNIIGL